MLAEVLGGVEADAAGADDRHPLADRFFIAQHVQIAQHLGVADAGDVRGTRHDAAGEDHFVEFA